MYVGGKLEEWMKEFNANKRKREETLDELPEEEDEVVIDDYNNIEVEDGNWRRVGECPKKFKLLIKPCAPLN